MWVSGRAEKRPGNPLLRKAFQDWWCSLNRQKERIQEEAKAPPARSNWKVLGFAPGWGGPLQVSALHTPQSPARGQVLERQQAACDVLSVHWPGFCGDASQSPLCNRDEGSQGGRTEASSRLHIELCQNQTPQRGEFRVLREAEFFFTRQCRS